MSFMKKLFTPNAYAEDIVFMKWQSLLLKCKTHKDLEEFVVRTIGTENDIDLYNFLDLQENGWLVDHTWEGDWYSDIVLETIKRYERIVD